MQNPAQFRDLARYGYVASSEDATALQTRLDVIFRALLREVPSVPADVDAGTLTADDVTDVVMAAAMRVLRNPEGIAEESSAIDDWRESRRRADSTEDVYFTAAELRRLRGPDALAGGWSGSFRYC